MIKRIRLWRGRGEEGFIPRETREGFGHWGVEYLFQSDTSADRDTKVCGFVCEAEVGPGALGDKGTYAGVGAWVAGGNQTTFGFVDTQA